MKESHLRKTVRFVFFVNEEPPYLQSENMCSRVYARHLRRKSVPVSAMISLETIGFYSDAAGSQNNPPVLGLFYPNRANFIGSVGNPESRDLVRRSVRRSVNPHASHPKVTVMVALTVDDEVPSALQARPPSEKYLSRRGIGRDERRDRAELRRNLRD